MLFVLCIAIFMYKVFVILISIDNPSRLSSKYIQNFSYPYPGVLYKFLISLQSSKGHKASKNFFVSF